VLRTQMRPIVTDYLSVGLSVGLSVCAAAMRPFTTCLNGTCTVDCTELCRTGAREINLLVSMATHLGPVLLSEPSYRISTQ